MAPLALAAEAAKPPTCHKLSMLFYNEPLDSTALMHLKKGTKIRPTKPLLVSLNQPFAKKEILLCLIHVIPSQISGSQLTIEELQAVLISDLSCTFQGTEQESFYSALARAITCGVNHTKDPS